MSSTITSADVNKKCLVRVGKPISWKYFGRIGIVGPDKVWIKFTHDIFGNEPRYHWPSLLPINHENVKVIE